MADTPDDAPWLPEGAFVGLGVCQVEGCDRVGWALPTYGKAIIEFTVSDELRTKLELPPHVMENVLLQVAWWCPVHGTGTETDIAKKWAQQVMDDVRAWIPEAAKRDKVTPDTAVRRHWEHQKDDVVYVAGNGLEFTMATGLHDKAIKAKRRQ